MEESIAHEVLGEGPAEDKDHANDILARIPDDIRATLNAEQAEAIREATREEWGQHPVNIRLRIPLFFRHYYFTLVCGICRRGAERYAVERVKHPLRTLSNILFVGASAAVVYLIVIGGLLIYSAVFEF